ncbi:hypothetical protein IIB79_02015 [candidate division KSB1 bacterium]|nr:hypothetical protein [candidate division KSB1 bacterium]
MRSIIRNKPESLKVAVFLVMIAAVFAAPVFGQTGAQNGNWQYWGGDAGSMRYSDLNQITPENFEDLEVAWRWSSANFGPAPEFYYRATAIAIDGVLYSVAGERRAVVAIDGATGETLWMWRLKETKRWEVSPRRFSGRGVAYTEVDGEGRILVTTPGFFMAMLDAKTGQPILSFGDNGIVDLMVGLGYDVDPETGILYVGSSTVVTAVALAPDPEARCGAGSLITEFGPGDHGYVGGRWELTMPNGDVVHFVCPLLGPGEPPA